MPLREATFADLLPASKIAAAAFKDEPMFGQYIHPHRDKYPEDMSLFFLHALRVDYVRGPDDHVLVTYAADSSGEEQRITGVAHWQRKRASKPPTGLYELVKVKAMESYNYLESFLYPNRAADPTRLDVLERMDPYTRHHWTGTRADTWYLALIAVDPKSQGHGAGRQMVEWGFERARKDKVGCSVISAEGKAGFYRKCGFDVDCGSAKDEGGEQNPGRDVPGGLIHFWDGGVEPQGIKKYGEA